MARRAQAPPKPPDWPPQRAYEALKKQLAELNRFRGQRYREVTNEEKGWQNLTLNILTHAFGEESNNVYQFVLHHPLPHNLDFLCGDGEAPSSQIRLRSTAISAAPISCANLSLAN